MDDKRRLAPCLIGKGTLANFRDMLRALETIESVEYRYVVDGELISEGEAALVKLMADEESSTMIVNGCMFINVASFRFVDFEQDDEEFWNFTLNGDGMVLELKALPETNEDETPRPHLLSEEIAPDYDVLIALDEDDDEE